MQRRPVQGTGLEESPQGLLVEVPVGTPDGVVVVPAGAEGVVGVDVVGVVGVSPVGVHAAEAEHVRAPSSQGSGKMLQNIKITGKRYYWPPLQHQHGS